MSARTKREFRNRPQRQHTSNKPSIGEFPDIPTATSSAPLWEQGVRTQDHMNNEVRILFDEDRISAGFDSWDHVRDEACMLRHRLAGNVRFVDAAISMKDSKIGSDRDGLRPILEPIYLEFMRFKKSRYALQDIHAEDVELLAAAKRLLDILP